MCDLQQWISQYLLDCQYQKGLDPKTIKAYRIDLAQFLELAGQKNFKFTRNEIMAYISRLHQQYKPKTIRRKIASIKAFFGYLEYEGLVQENPFSKLRIKLAIPVILPRTIPLSVISSILASAYQQKETARSQIQRDGTLRDIAVLELLFATGVRVSELCTLGYDDVRLEEGEIKIYGKGAKERFVQIANPNVLGALHCYQEAYKDVITQSGAFFVNRLHKPLSDQSVRSIVNKYCRLAGVESHITPHMFRHPYVKHTTKIFSLRLMDFQAQAYPDARRKTRGACQLLRVGQSRSPVRPLCNRKRFSHLPPQSKMSWILYAISMRLSGYTSTRSISSSASSVVSVSASKIALDASLRLSCRACSSCFCFACANTAA